MRRWRDWFRQAQRKLDSARWDNEGKFYEDACFSAQQAAELAAKALLQYRGKHLRGHSVLALLREAGAPRDILDQARILDQYYIPTRYPNGFDGGAPMDYFTESQAKEAISYAEDILEYVEQETA